MTFTYTSFDSVQTRTDARGAVTSYGYDALNRLQTVTYNTSSAPGVATTAGVTINYRTSAPGKGQVSSITEGLGSESYVYDSMGRVSSKTRVIDTRSYQSQYQYNGANQLTLMIYPSGKRVRVNRDTRGRLSGLDKVDASNNVLLGYMSQVGYNTAGQVTGLNLGNGVAESFGYSNDRLQLTSQTATKGAATLMSLTYNYAASAGASGVGTAAGNSGQLMTITGTINSQSRNQAFTYDNVGRLTTATGWSAWQRRFAYDRWGNRTGMWNAVSGGSQLQSIALQMSGSAPTNRIGDVNGVSYVYDASGNVTNDGAYSYTYDAESRLVSVSVGGSGSYGYDSANRRIKKVSGGVTTHYVWEGSEVIAEYDGTTGTLISEYVNAGGRMIREQGSAIRYYHSDRLSTRLITDGAGVVAGTQDHLPFGEDAGVVGESEKHRFTAYERDSESGSDYAINRQYAMATGRFTRPDPFDGSYDVFDPQTLNRYSYVGNNPVDFADPLGLLRICFFSIREVWVGETPENPTGRANVLVFEGCIDLPDIGFIGVGIGIGETPEPEKKRNCTFPSFDQLSAAQKSLLGKDGANVYNSLTDAQKASFLNITGALANAGINFSGLSLQQGGIQQDRLLFASGEGIDGFKTSIEAGIKNKTFINATPNGKLHPGMAEFGARQNRSRNALQVGTGPEGAFADIDRGNPRKFGGFLIHAAEVLTPGKTDPFAVGKSLGKKVTGYECK